ncbi:MAG: electron transport complex subunit RsxC, partial [Deltaproteobacteria bacterium]
RPHPSGVAMPAVVIKPDGEDRWIDGLEKCDPEQLTPEEISEKIRAAGVVGMGGATFPTHVKLSPPEEKKIDTLILNGVECEPFLTADHRLMLEETDRLLKGVAILQKVLGVEHVAIGIEANKPDAISLLQERCKGTPFVVEPLEVKYPQGAEKQLILAVTGREVPSGGLPMDVGVVVHNVGTAAAIADAVIEGKPLIERICTVTGPAIKEPKNLRIRIGTPLQHLVEICCGTVEEPAKIIMGGPMMGSTQVDLSVMTTRGTSGLLLLREQDITGRSEGPCIRCSRCVEVCAMNLLPTTIAAYARRDLLAEAEEYHALDCIECGCCSYTCPSSIPLVQIIRYAKTGIMEQKRKQAS